MKKRMKRIKICLVAMLGIATLVGACSNPKPAPDIVAKSAVQYTCPMHSQILEDRPGSCPICGMTLVKKSGQASEGAGISLNTVLQPVNSAVLSNVKAMVPQQKEVPRTISAQGYLDF